jgi:rhamnosyltransferase
VWADLGGFREDLQYAEDDDYTRRCKALGWAVRYVPDSVVMHSHNYTAEQARKRAFGDAKAIGQAWNKTTHSYGWLRTVVLGTISDLRHDFRFCYRQRRLAELPHAARIRVQQRLGRWQGFHAGYGAKAEEQRTKSQKCSVLSAQSGKQILRTEH